MKIISGNSNKPLAERVCSLLGQTLAKIFIRSFNDKEISVEILDDITQEDIFLIQSTSYPVNDHLMELLVICNALKHCSPRQITAVIPYYGYARQDRQRTLRSSVASELTAHLLKAAGIHRIIALDLHTPQIQCFFEGPFYNIPVVPLFYQDALTLGNKRNLMLISPDQGGSLRAINFATLLKSNWAIIQKYRDESKGPCTMKLEARVQDRNCIIIDDIVDTAETLCKAAEILMRAGAKTVSAYVTHGILSSNAVERINLSSLQELVLTDSIHPTVDMGQSKKIRYLSIAPLLSDAIMKI